MSVKTKNIIIVITSVIVLFSLSLSFVLLPKKEFSESERRPLASFPKLTVSTLLNGSFMKDSGINVTEMNSGCICCSLVGDFSVALKEVLETYSPDRILIEPSGVGKLSDVIRAVMNIGSENIKLNSFVAVVDA